MPTSEYKNMACRMYLSHIRDLVELQTASESLIGLLEVQGDESRAADLRARRDEYDAEIKQARKIIVDGAGGRVGAEILDKKLFEGKSYDEIARELYYSPGYVKKLARTARETLYWSLPPEYK